MVKTFIVCEVSKNWVDGCSMPVTPVDCLAEKFEDIINTNLKRGYELTDWRLATSQMMVPSLEGDGRMVPSYIETIIGLFKLMRKAG